MFKLIFRVLLLGIFFSGWSLAALSLHVVRTPDKLGLIPKERLGFTDTFVDARKWTLADTTNHPELVKRVLEANKAELFRYLASPSNGDIAQQLSGAISASGGAETNSIFGTVKGLLAPSDRGSATQKLASFPLEF